MGVRLRADAIIIASELVHRPENTRDDTSMASADITPGHTFDQRRVRIDGRIAGDIDIVTGIRGEGISWRACQVTGTVITITAHRTFSLTTSGTDHIAAASLWSRHRLG